MMEEQSSRRKPLDETWRIVRAGGMQIAIVSGTNPPIDVMTGLPRHEEFPDDATTIYVARPQFHRGQIVLVDGAPGIVESWHWGVVLAGEEGWWYRVLTPHLNIECTEGAMRDLHEYLSECSVRMRARMNKR